MIVKVKRAKLHDSLFCSGTNLGMLLDPSRRGGIKMIYDSDTQELRITYNTETARVPINNVSYWIEGEAIDAGQVLPEAPKAKIQAQVETPQSHVFEGAGKGKVR